MMPPQSIASHNVGALYDRHHNFNTLAAAIFAQINMWDMDLNTISGFADAVADDLQAIEQKGIRLAVEKLLS